MLTTLMMTLMEWPADAVKCDAMHACCFTSGEWQIVSLYWRQGPQNLYGRDSKLRPTFKSGAEKRVLSVPLLMTWCFQSAPNRSYIFETFSGGNTKTGEGFSPLRRLFPLDDRPPSHFFRASAAADWNFVIRTVVAHCLWWWTLTPSNPRCKYYWDFYLSNPRCEYYWDSDSSNPRCEYCWVICESLLMAR